MAEHDIDLERYFVETETFRSLVEDRVDVIAGDKGTGKTALFRILQGRYTSIPELDKVEIVAGFNPAGNPVFQRLAEGDVLNEGQYITIWKGYFVSLVGNWVLDLEDPGSYTDTMTALDSMLTRVGLRSRDDSPSTIFSQIVNLFRRLAHPQSIETAVTITPNGLPIVIPKVTFADTPTVPGEAEVVEHETAFQLLSDVLEELDLTVWLVMDRLDEAFQGFPDAEVPALRALFRSYLDLLQFPRVKLKLFVRRDLFARIIEGGFVNLTHINARKLEIAWDENDLYDLLCKRIAESKSFVEALGIGTDEDAVFNATFPEQVDAGDRKPTTWNWMMGRIRDANNVRPPRNLIDLVSKARQIQMRREEQQPQEYEQGSPLLSSDSLKRGLEKLSAERVQDTLLAEAGSYAATIALFEGGKAEHNHQSLSALLGDENLRERIRVLEDLGFIESVGDTYKVPMIYRDGLGITQGKAF